MGSLSRAVVALLIACGGIAAGMPAQAAANAASVSISAPSRVNPGWQDYFTVRGTASDADSRLYVSIMGPNGYEWNDSDYVSGEEPYDLSFYPDRLSAEGTYEVRAYLNGSLVEASRFISAEYVRPEFTRADLSRDSFYPTVRDGFRDTINVRAKTREKSEMRLKIINSKGRTVASWGPTTYNPNRHTFLYWTWNGKFSGGKTVPVGRYRAKLTAESLGGTRSTTVKILVKSDVITKKYYESWRGSQYDRLNSTGSCWADSYLSRATLNCWDFYNSTRDYAEAQYWFDLPKNARNIKWGMNGEYNCCNEPGRVIRKGERVSPTRYVVKVTVDGYRSYDVFKAWASWTAKVRR